MTDELVALREAAFVAEGTQFTCFTGTKVQILTLLPSSFVAKADLVPAGKGRDEYVMTIMSKQVIVFTCFTSTCFTSTTVQLMVMTSMATRHCPKVQTLTQNLVQHGMNPATGQWVAACRFS